MENHQFQWVNQLWMAIFNSKLLVYHGVNMFLPTGYVTVCYGNLWKPWLERDEHDDVPLQTVDVPWKYRQNHPTRSRFHFLELITGLCYENHQRKTSSKAITICGPPVTSVPHVPLNSPEIFGQFDVCMMTRDFCPKSTNCP